MRKPVILTVDDDPGVLAAISRDLRAQYGENYQVLSATSGHQALDVLGRLVMRDQPVALIATDQRMPQMTGIETLAAARKVTPEAKLLLLTAYADTDVAINAINEIGLDYYLLKPWDPPHERLYPVVTGLLDDWAANHLDHSADVRVVGYQWSENTYETKSFLTRNHVPYHWYDLDRDEPGQRLLEIAGEAGDSNQFPLVFLPDGQVLRAPTMVAVADALGLRTKATQPLYDVCVVGGGPAGLAAAVYAASEGLNTVVVEREAPGGQAGQSAAIENYLGFPKGLSGSDLAHRAAVQVTRFGAELVLAREVVGFETRGPARAVLLNGGASIEARAVIVATGVSYRPLGARGAEALTGRGVYYGVNASDASQCSGDDVYLVGAGNSAGQAALNLAKYAARVIVVVRGASLAASMSQYLVDRIQDTSNIDVQVRHAITGVQGQGRLESIELTDRDSGECQTVPARWLFVFIGAEPHTNWLENVVRRDDHGFIITGRDLVTSASQHQELPWPLAREPLPLETAVPGVFAAGDVRLDSMKRVASAVGEGAMAVANIHQYLALT